MNVRFSDMISIPAIPLANPELPPFVFSRRTIPESERTWPEARPRMSSPSPDATSRVGEYPVKVVDKWGIFKANRAKYCLANWRTLTSDPWFLKNIHGYKIEFSRLPYQDRPIHEIRFTPKEEAIMADEIQKLLKKGAIVESQEEQDQFVSNVFLRDKKEPGKYRMIFNLTKLNDFVEYHHFKMKTLDTAL